METLSDAYYNGNLLSGAVLNGDKSQINPTGSPKKSMLEFSVILTPTDYYELPKGSYQITAEFKFSNHDVDYEGEWQ